MTKEKNFAANLKHAYFIGIGGAGMSALARILQKWGVSVKGSDLKESRTTRELILEGIPVYYGQDEIRFGESDVVIYSSAIPDHHFELAKAREMGLSTYHRAEVLSMLFNQAETSIAVTGTHGKTTTTSMIAYALLKMRKDPTCMVGGDLLDFKTNALSGSRDLWVAEVDESDQTHELFTPNYAVITNLEEEHIDRYKNFQDLENSFVRFLSRLHEPGGVIVWGDDAALKRIAVESTNPLVTFGLSEENDFAAKEIQLEPFGSSFDLMEMGFFARRVRLAIPGLHNIRNALASIALLTQMGCDLDPLCDALACFQGARRRLQLILRTPKVTVIDDYAHHPTELRASISALRGMAEHVVVVFQPHRFTRTKFFFKEFAAVLQEADEVVLTEIYSAGEPDRVDASSTMIYNSIHPSKRNCASLIEREDLVDHLMGKMRAGSVVAFIGAGDIGDVAYEYADRFKSCLTA